MAKIKTKYLVSIIAVIAVVAIGYYAAVTGFFVKSNQTGLRNDCGKSLSGYRVIFAYSPSCPHCHKMMSIVEKYSNVYWIDVTTDSCKNIIEEYKNVNCNTNNPNTCPMDFVPTFVCINDKSYYKVGEMTEQEFNSWIDGCK